uniref:Uncharacterized protein n=1 Tax=Glossina pallidipes TaxID=7398 RepID=A0A1B0ADJ6_GLOPL
MSREYFIRRQHSLDIARQQIKISLSYDFTVDIFVPTQCGSSSTSTSSSSTLAKLIRDKMTRINLTMIRFSLSYDSGSTVTMIYSCGKAYGASRLVRLKKLTKFRIVTNALQNLKAFPGPVCKNLLVQVSKVVSMIYREFLFNVYHNYRNQS